MTHLSITKAFTSVYSMLKFSALNCDNGCERMLSETPLIYRVLKESTQMHFKERHFAGTKTSPKRASSGQKIVKEKFRVKPILESILNEFQRLFSLREGLVKNVVRHCFLMLCSPISFDGIETNVATRNANEDDIIEQMKKYQINLTILSPIQDQSYGTLFELANGNPVDPIYDKIWQTVFLSNPLMKLHINDPQCSIIGPLAAAHHAEEQGKLAMRATFENVNPSPLARMVPGYNSNPLSFNGQSSTTESPKQPIQSVDSPDQSKNPGSASAYFNCLAGPQSVSSGSQMAYNNQPLSNQPHNMASVQSPYSTGNNQAFNPSAASANNIPHSPYGIGQPKEQYTRAITPASQGAPYPQNNLEPSQMTQNNFQGSYGQTFSPSNNSMKSNSQMNSQPLSNNGRISGPGSLNNSISNGRKSLPEPNSIHSNHTNENPQSWGQPFTPTQQEYPLQEQHQPSSVYLTGQPGQLPDPVDMNRPKSVNRGPLSVPSPSMANQPSYPQNNNNFIPHSPSGQNRLMHNNQIPSVDQKGFKNQPPINRQPLHHGQAPMDSLGMLITGNHKVPPGGPQQHPNYPISSAQSVMGSNDSIVGSNPMQAQLRQSSMGQNFPQNPQQYPQQSQQQGSTAMYHGQNFNRNSYASSPQMANPNQPPSGQISQTQQFINQPQIPPSMPNKLMQNPMDEMSQMYYQQQKMHQMPQQQNQKFMPQRFPVNSQTFDTKKKGSSKMPPAQMMNPNMAQMNDFNNGNHLKNQPRVNNNATPVNNQMVNQRMGNPNMNFPQKHHDNFDMKNPANSNPSMMPSFPMGVQQQSNPQYNSLNHSSQQMAGQPKPDNYQLQNMMLQNQLSRGPNPNSMMKHQSHQMMNPVDSFNGPQPNFIVGNRDPANMDQNFMHNADNRQMQNMRRMPPMKMAPSQQAPPDFSINQQQQQQQAGMNNNNFQMNQNQQQLFQNFYQQPNQGRPRF